MTERVDKKLPALDVYNFLATGYHQHIQRYWLSFWWVQIVMQCHFRNAMSIGNLAGLVAEDIYVPTKKEIVKYL